MTSQKEKDNKIGIHDFLIKPSRPTDVERVRHLFRQEQVERLCWRSGIVIGQTIYTQTNRPLNLLRCDKYDIIVTLNITLGTRCTVIKLKISLMSNKLILQEVGVGTSRYGDTGWGYFCDSWLTVHRRDQPVWIHITVCSNDPLNFWQIFGGDPVLLF